MTTLIPAASGRPGDDPIFALHAEATRRSAAGEAVINATLGALLEDDGRLAVMPSVFDAFRAVDPVRAAAYAPINGVPAFLDAVRLDAFGPGRLFERSVAAATPGGTGALHHAVVNFVAPGQALYTSDYFWGPYATIAAQTQRSVETFRLFDARGVFDLGAFEGGLARLLARQGRALVVLNDPCHNPTGYSLDAEEWRGIADVLGAAAEHGSVAVLVDLAYAHFANGDRFDWSRALEAVADRVTVLAAWTASKSFTQYGARVGALVASVAEKAERLDVANALAYSCRGTWSNCNHLGMLGIASILGDDAKRALADRERRGLVELLSRRVSAFNAAARPAGLTYPRYEGGFFVSVFTPDAKRTAATCREAGVFVVPLAGAVRIALCSTPARDVPRLVDVVARGVEIAEVSLR